MKLHTPPRVDTSVWVGGFENLAILLDDGGIPVNEFLGGAILLAIASVEPLCEHDTAIIDRCGAVVNNVVDATGRVMATKAPRKRKVIAIY